VDFDNFSASLPGLTRQSMQHSDIRGFFAQALTQREFSMDARVKPAHDV
jgi:dTDP-4-dehydrorhamnose 3,5-epimerase-like enzyme